MSPDARPSSQKFPSEYRALPALMDAVFFIDAFFKAWIAYGIFSATNTSNLCPSKYPRPQIQASFWLLYPQRHCGSLKLPLVEQKERLQHRSGPRLEQTDRNPAASNSLITANERFIDLAGLLLSNWQSRDMIPQRKWCNRCWLHYVYMLSTLLYIIYYIKMVQ